MISPGSPVTLETTPPTVFLPQREALPALFEPWFGTPGSLDAAAAASLFGGRHAPLRYKIAAWRWRDSSLRSE